MISFADGDSLHAVLCAGSMPFSVEFDITGTDGLAHRLEAEPAARGWIANA